MAEQCKDLPEECWELILSFLDDHSHLEPISLVSKKFFSLTNRLRRSFTLIQPTILIHGTVSKLLHRFPNLTSIDLSKYHEKIDEIISEIACSSLLNIEFIDVSNQKRLPIKGLTELGLRVKNLRVLKCSNVSVLRDNDLVVISNVLPNLEELDISYPGNNCVCIVNSEVHGCVTDIGIEALVMNLKKNMRKLDVSGNHFITDKSVVSLSLNCLLLRELAVLDCSFITENGIHFLLRNSPNLRSILLNCGGVPFRSLSFDLLSCARVLCALHFCDMSVSDEVLFSIAKACIPLKRLSVSCCTNFTFSGISSLLSTYRSLEYLALVKVDIFTDQSMIDLSPYLCKLVTISLGLCSKLTCLTFFTLANNCRLLKDIEMDRTNLGKGDSFTNFIMNPQIKSLNLAGNQYLSDECLKEFASICPNLEQIDVSYCRGITEVGIAEILESCQKVTEVQINDCIGVKNIGTGSELPKLEVLCASRSGIDDEGLAIVGKRCFGLLKLDLEGCVDVTTRAVVELLSNCERLREINLGSCYEVNIQAVGWMVFARSSLRKITPPGCYSFTENEKKFFLHHGCLVCDSMLEVLTENTNVLEEQFMFF